MSPSDAKIRSIKPSDNPFKLTDSHLCQAIAIIKHIHEISSHLELMLPGTAYIPIFQLFHPGDKKRT